MFRNILVPVNFTTDNKKALDIAVKIAANEKGSVHLLHVVEIIANTTFTEFKEFYSKLEMRAQKRMDSLITLCKNDQVEILPTIFFGDRVEEILAFSKKRRIDLIVMNSHKISLDNPSQGWGTISYKIGILSQCPVMLVK
ncbi:MAG: universal stress protein [Deltaproteobacteria bacterium]|nr:universal stress protein [Deltaproteobacteria bacterium]